MTGLARLQTGRFEWIENIGKVCADRTSVPDPLGSVTFGLPRSGSEKKYGSRSGSGLLQNIMLTY
jgi:hypothetical protein